MSIALPAPVRPGSLRVLRRLSTYLGPHRALVGFVVLCLLVHIGGDVALPWLLGRAVETIGAGGPIGWLIGLILAAGLLRSVARFGQGVGQTRLAQRIVTDLRLAYHRRVLGLSFAEHDQLRKGELLARGTRDIEKARNFFADILFQAIELLVLIGGALVVMGLATPIFAAVAFVLVAAAGGAKALAAPGLRRRVRDEDDAYDEVATAIQENVAGTRVVKAFGQEEREIDRFGRAIEGYLARCYRAFDFFAWTMPVANMGFQLSIPIFLALGGWLVVERGLPIGEVAAALFYLGVVQHRLRVVGRLVMNAQVAVASADRIFDVLDRPRRIAAPASPVALPAGGRGRIVLDGVSFGYEGGDSILHEVDLVVEAGRTVAVVGPTGSGKSSLVGLLGRFHDPVAGSIGLDGVDLTDLDPAVLRRQVGVVFQETFLFSATIAENIAFGHPAADREAVVRAAGLAQADRFIGELPDGYDTVVGERGVTLSGGQRQRLAIARAILHDPRVLVLDDATASVDSRTERKLQSSLEVAGAGRTTLVIAHRLSTVRRADRIVVLEAGRVAAEGTHEQLVGTNAWYTETFLNQQQSEGARTA